MDFSTPDPYLVRNVQIALDQGDDEGAIECVLAALNCTRDEAVDIVEYCDRLHGIIDITDES